MAKNKTKIIIHNDTNLEDFEVMSYVHMGATKKFDNGFIEFNNGIKVQQYKRPTGWTFYVYGGLKDDSNNS